MSVQGKVYKIGGLVVKKRRINNYSQYKKKKIEYGPIIDRRLKILIAIIILSLSSLVVKLYFVQIVRHEYYNDMLVKLTQNIVEGESAPRGRIYDRNGKLLVDNVPVKSIYYKKAIGVSTAEEISMSYKVADLIELDYRNLKESQLRKFWVKSNPSLANAKITAEERQLVKERKLASADIENMKLARVTEEELAVYEERDKKAAYIYYLMNNGYSYAEKPIKFKDVTDEEYAIIAERSDELRGFITRIDWERYYPYGTVFRSILGNVSSTGSGVPAELKEQYLANGYKLTDRVGISYLEYQYESILRGTKAKYLVENGEYKLLEEGKRGNDIVLTIDIELQKAVEQIIIEEIIAAKSEPRTQYFDTAFVVIQNPNTGEILAMAGKQVVLENGKYAIYDYTPGVINASITAGSSVKAASHMVGYMTGALKIGEVRNDACIKLAGAPRKCSVFYYGNVNDLEALKVSSNTYQFHTAMKVAGLRYSYDMRAKVSEEAFNTYRSIFGQFGLGVKTGIDLPKETIGFRGSEILPGLLLDFAIGQYDNYTPIQLSQYISTVANGGNRMQPYLLKSVYEPTPDKLTSLVYQTSPVVLNTINADPIYLNRVKEGLKLVMTPGGTGYQYIDPDKRPAGKTGTSQSFIDTTGDGTIDTETLSNVFVAYAPYDYPTVTFTIVTPHISPGGYQSWERTRVNRRIAQKVSQKYFEIYK